MESMLEGTVIYLQFVDYILDAAKKNKEPEGRTPKQQEKYYLGKYIYNKNKKYIYNKKIHI